MARDSWTLKDIEANKEKFPVGSVCYIKTNHNSVEATVVAHLKETIKVSCKNYLNETIFRSFKARNVEEVGSSKYSVARLVTPTKMVSINASEELCRAENELRAFSTKVAERLHNTIVEETASALRELANEFEALQQKRNDKAAEQKAAEALLNL